MKRSGSRGTRPELSYANAAQPRLKRWLIRAVEAGSGRKRYERLYGIWRDCIVPAQERVFRDLLELVGIQVQVSGNWPIQAPASPLVLLANHPFGIGDGLAMLALAEQLGRPFRVLLHADLLKVPEITPYALPVDFGASKEALARNIAVRHEAVRLLREGVSIVIFPAGGVATAPTPFGKASDLPWKIFVARLIQDAKASVLPVHFQGQNSRLFHLISQPMALAESEHRVARLVGNAALTLRLALLVREFARLGGKTIRARAGAIIPWAELEPLRDRKRLLHFLHDAVMSLDGETPAYRPVMSPQFGEAFEAA